MTDGPDPATTAKSPAADSSPSPGLPEHPSASAALVGSSTPTRRKRSHLSPEERRRLRKQRQHRRRLRLRRHGRRAYIRSVYFLPSLATLGNAICGFGALYAAALTSQFNNQLVIHDPNALAVAQSGFAPAAYLIFLAMVFDALDGRLARFARHTTDFGGQLDSMADVVSFGVAPAFVALQLFKMSGPALPLKLNQLVWAIGALYMSCAAIRLARFNVSNEHGEQHHFSFLGLPSPGAAGAVAAVVLAHHELMQNAGKIGTILAPWIVALLPLLVLVTGLLMVSEIRYPHLVNRYLRGKRSIGRLISVLALVLLIILEHQYTVAVVSVGYAFCGPVMWLMARRRFRRNGISAT